MSPGEKVELALIPVAAAAAFLLAPALPDRVAAGSLVLACSALLLAQSLVRDLALLASARRRARDAPVRTARCMCVESALGATGVVAGAVALFAGYRASVDMSPGLWAAAAGGVVAGGFLIKDLVFGWNPWRLRRDKDHMNIVFTLKR